MKYKITGPDGRSMVLTAPDGATPEQIQDKVNKVKQQWGTAPPEAKTVKDYGIDFTRPTQEVRASVAALPEIDQPEAVKQWQQAKVQSEGPANTVARGMRHIARGTITGSYLDEADAGFNAAIHKLTGGRAGVPYDEALEYDRARNRQEDEISGATGTGLKLVGGFASGAPIAKWIVRKAKSKLGRAAALGVAGAGAGGAYGFGDAEGGEGPMLEQLSRRLPAAETGAKWGLGLGLAIPAVGRGGAFLAQKGAEFLPGVKSRLPKWMTGSNASDVADEWMASKLKRGGVSPKDLLDDFDKGQYAARLGSNSKLGYKGVRKKNALLPEMVADTSDSLRRLLGAVYRTGNEAGDLVKTRLESRQRGPDNFYAVRTDQRPRGQIERVIDAYDRAMQIRTKGTARQNEKAIIARQKEKGDKLYGEARAQSQDFDIAPALDALKTTMDKYPVDFARKLGSALELFQRPQVVKGVPLNSSINNVTLFDNAKGALDDMIAGAKRTGEDRMAMELKTFKDNLLAEVHAGGKNPKYKEAREVWGSEAENREALDLGRQALREHSEVSVEHFKDLSPAQQKLFRIGLRESIRNAYGSKTSGDDVTRLFDQRRVKELLAEAIPRTPEATPAQGPWGQAARKKVFSDRPERFGEVMRREARMVQTKNKVLGNSETAGRVQDDAEMASDALSRIITSGRSITNYALEAVGTAAQKAFGYRSDVALQLARRLTETDPTKRAVFLNQISQQMGPSRFAEFVRLLGDTSGLAAIPTAVSGQTPQALPASSPRQP